MAAAFLRPPAAATTSLQVARPSRPMLIERRLRSVSSMRPWASKNWAHMLPTAPMRCSRARSVAVR
jgi:hypothetical protein